MNSIKFNCITNSIREEEKNIYLMFAMMLKERDQLKQRYMFFFFLLATDAFWMFF